MGMGENVVTFECFFFNDKYTSNERLELRLDGSSFQVVAECLVLSSQR